MNNPEQRRRMQEINAKIAMLCDYNRALQNDVKNNTDEINALLEERNNLGE